VQTKITKIGVSYPVLSSFYNLHPVDFNGASSKPAFSLLTSLICHYKFTAMWVGLLRVTTVNLTAVDVKDAHKNDVKSASSHTRIYFLFSVEVHSSDNRLRWTSAENRSVLTALQM